MPKNVLKHVGLTLCPPHWPPSRRASTTSMGLRILSSPVFSLYSSAAPVEVMKSTYTHVTAVFSVTFHSPACMNAAQASKRQNLRYMSSPPVARPQKQAHHGRRSGREWARCCAEGLEKSEARKFKAPGSESGRGVTVQANTQPIACAPNTLSSPIIRKCLLLKVPHHNVL